MKFAQYFSTMRGATAYKAGIVGAVCAFLTACAPGEDGNIIDASDGITVNGLDAQKDLLAVFKSASMLLDGAVLQSRLNTAASVGLEESVDGRVVLKYLARCAMPEGASMLLPTGEEFAGAFGVGTVWMDGTCDETCQRWVTACLLAHSNGVGENVQISLRGHPNITPSESVVSKFSFEEAAFFGNVFNPDRTQLLDGLYHCPGRGWLEDPLGALLSGDSSRACASEAGLGGGDVGQCPGSSAGPCTLACDEDLGTNGWSDCHGLLTDNTVFEEVITVYLEPAE